MNRRDLIWFLGLEVLAIAVAGLSFALIASRVVAGLVAGAYFIGSAGWMLARLCRWSKPLAAMVTYPLVLHLFVVSIPMVITRLWNAGADFHDVRILGLPGPEFHRVSTTVFGLVIAATCADLVRTVTPWRRRSKAG